MIRKSRYSVVLLLAFAISFGSFFAAPITAEAVQTSNEASQGNNQTTTQPTTVKPAPAKPADQTGVIKGKDGFYRYKDPKTKKIRTKAGFIKWNGYKYYIYDGGKIAAGRTFKVGKHHYHAYANGKIPVGVHIWSKAQKLYYSDKDGHWVKIKSHRCQKGVKWKGNWYYLQTDSTVATNRPVVINNLPYFANSKGVCSKIAVNQTNNAVLKVARKQLGKHTKSQVKKFWTWYYGTRFIDTDRTPWCASFVAWCYRDAGKYGKMKRVRNYGSLGYVPTYSRYARNRGKWIARKKAKAGDIIVFGRNRHVGIVERVYKGYIYTIEGNSGPTAEIGTGKPGAVTRRVYKLSDPDIKGVLRP